MYIYKRLRDGAWHAKLVGGAEHVDVHRIEYTGSGIVYMRYKLLVLHIHVYIYI